MGTSYGCPVVKSQSRRLTSMSDALMSVAFPAVMAVVVAVVCSQVTKAAARGDLPRSGAVGIRTGALKASDAAWEAGHRAAEPVARVLTLVVSAAAMIVIIVSIIADGGWVTVLGIVPFIIVLVGLIPVVRAANAAANAAPTKKPKRR